MSGREATPLFTRLKAKKRLPSPAGTAMRVLELCRDEDSGLKEISDVVSSDPALAARLLKFANSAATGLQREVTSVREAVMLMGVRSVKLAALGFCLAVTESKAGCLGFDLTRYWSEACATAVIARAIAKEHFSVEPEEAFTAGLLAKIGRLAIAQGIPEDYVKVLELSESGTPQDHAEKRLLGSDYAEFGAELLADWSLPNDLVEAVHHQLHPAQAEGRAAALARVIATALAITPAIAGGPLSAPEQAALRELVSRDLGMNEAAWGQFAGAITAAYAEAAAVLNITISPGAALDLYAEAQEEAARVGIVAQLERARATDDAKDLLRRATTDALTGVANRARFDERLAEMTKGLSREHEGVALIMFDIDHFKKFNDTHGHQVGDLVLTRVARAVQNSLREVDVLARYGGEEFAILAPATKRDGACLIAARTQKCIESLRVQVEGRALCVTISLGVAVTDDLELPTATQLIGEADKQLYLSKAGGRNTWSYHGRTAAKVAVPTKAA